MKFFSFMPRSIIIIVLFVVFVICTTHAYPSSFLFLSSSVASPCFTSPPMARNWAAFNAIRRFTKEALAIQRGFAARFTSTQTSSLQYKPKGGGTRPRRDLAEGSGWEGLRGGGLASFFKRQLKRHTSKRAHPLWVYRMSLLRLFESMPRLSLLRNPKT